MSRADLLKIFLRSEETLEWDVSEVIERHLGSADTVKVRISVGVVSLDGSVESQEQVDRLLASVRSVPVLSESTVSSSGGWPPR